MGILTGLMKMAVRGKRLLKGDSAQTRYTRYLEQIQFKTPEELKALQAVSLCELMKHAVANIPYYKSLADHLILTPESAFEDIRKFPILSKHDMAGNPSEFMDSGTEILKRYHTGGTTGMHFDVYSDKYFTDHAVDEYFNSKIGIYPGMSRLIVNLVGQGSLLNKSSDNNISINKLTGVYTVDHRFLNEEKLKIATQILEKYKPRIIWGNTHGVYTIAKYLLDNKVNITYPEVVLCGGDTLLDRYKATIQTAFNQKLFDRYGAAESGNTANQCSLRKGYHYSPVTHFIEILDENDEPVKDGESGSIVITTLTKRAMPMIRYRLGDMVVKSSQLCECGSNFPVIGAISGREKEGIRSPKGTYISTAPMEEILSKSGKMSEYQAVHYGNSDILIKVVCINERFTVNDEEEIRKDIHDCLDCSMNISFKYVDEIKPLPNGKMIHIISSDRLKELEGYDENL